MAYDSLLVIALLFAAGFIAVIIFGDDVPSGTLWFQFLLLVVWWAYFAVCWKMGGQTVAMRTWRIRLIRADGAAITWTDTDRKSTRLNSSHVAKSYAVFCLKKKIKTLVSYE